MAAIDHFSGVRAYLPNLTELFVYIKMVNSILNTTCQFTDQLIHFNKPLERLMNQPGFHGRKQNKRFPS